MRDATGYGLSASGTAPANGAALSALAASLGEGGSILVPAGSFAATNIALPRGVELVVTGTLVGAAGQSVVKNATYSTTGSIAAGSTFLTLSSLATPLLEPSDIVAVSGAGPLFDELQMVHYAQVEWTLGTLVCLDRPAVTTAHNVTVTWGASDVTISGTGTIDGGGGTDVVSVTYANNVTVTGVTVTNAVHGGVSYAWGSRGGLIDNVTVTNCGNMEDVTGSAVWLFGGVAETIIEDLTVTHSTYAVIVDDRSVTATVTDASSHHNTIRRVTSSNTSGGIVIHGSDDNIVEDFDIGAGPGTGLSIDGSDQGVTEYRPAERNTIRNGTVTGMGVGLWIARFGVATGTTHTGITYTGCTTNVIDES